MFITDSSWYLALYFCLSVFLPCWWINVFIWVPSVLWRCWLGGRKGIRPVKTEWWGTGVLICLERGADLYMARLMPLPLTVSCSSKIQIGFTFLVPAYPGSPGKKAVKCCSSSVVVVPTSRDARSKFSHAKLMATKSPIGSWSGTVDFWSPHLSSSNVTVQYATAYRSLPVMVINMRYPLSEFLT